MMLHETPLGSREQTPATDINFNSPGHRSSVDGSFIQEDDTEMHLILDFESESRLGGKGAILPSHIYQPTSVLTASWISRQQTQWATDFDANIAELDFDAVDTRDILYLQPAATNQRDDSTWPRNVKQCHVAPQDNYHRSMGNQPLQGSLDLSISHSDSLLSSCDPVDALATVESMVQSVNIGSVVETNSESMHLSKVVAEGEQLIAACMTRPRDYVLTWEAASKIADSINVSSIAEKESNKSVDFYQDAQLSTAIEPIISPKNEASECKDNKLSVVAWPERNDATLCVSDHVMTTWGAIKKASEHNVSDTRQASKSHSLPDLNPHPMNAMLMQCSGAGEHMLSLHNKDNRMPLFDIMTSSSTSHQSSKLSLLQVFQNKMCEQGIDTCAPVDPIQDNQSPQFEPQGANVDDHEYTEYYVRGRYIDMNHNEVGYSPPSTEGIQSVNPNPTPISHTYQRRNSVMSESISDTETTTANDRWNLVQPAVVAKPARTFASLLQNEEQKKTSATQLPVYMVEQSVQTHEQYSGQLVPTVVLTNSSQSPPSFSNVNNLNLKDITSKPLPSLEFLEFPFKVPSLFPNAPPFPVDFLESSLPTRESMEECGYSRETPNIAGPSAWPVPNYPALIGHTQNETPNCATKSNKPILHESQSFAAALMENTGLLLPPINLNNQGQLAAIVADMTLPHGFTPSPSTSSSSKLASTRDRDSGLGTSGASGPSHVKDWDSLAVLLPNNVLQACSYMRGENTTSPRGTSIDKPAPRSHSRRRQKHHQHCSSRRRPFSAEPLFERRGCPAPRFESIREEDSEGYTCCPSPFRDPHDPLWCHSLPSYCHHAVHCHNCCVCPCRKSSCCRNSSVESECGGPKMGRHRSNLERWRTAYTTSDSESDSGSDSISHPNLGRHRVPLHSISSDSEAGQDFAQPESDLMVRSECPRPRPSSLPRKVMSVQNMASSFLRPAAPSVTTRSMSDVSRACATCYRVRSPSVERVPQWADAQVHDPVWRQWFCDCTTSDILEELEQDERRRRRARCLITFLDGLKAATMSEEESSLLSTPLYQSKKDLVQNVITIVDKITVEFAAIKVTGNTTDADKAVLVKLVTNELCPGIYAILCDGLREASNVWMIVTGSATPGPATKSIHELVSGLEDDECSQNQWPSFLNGLLTMQSLDCWLSYLALKERLLECHYVDSALMRRATSAYRSIFTRLLISVQSLSLQCFDKLSLCPPPKPTTPKRFSLLPTRLASDSRVPKSSSVPARLCPARTSKSRSVDSGLARLRKTAGVGTKSPTRIPLPVSKSHTTGWRHEFVEDGEVVLCLY